MGRVRVRVRRAMAGDRAHVRRAGAEGVMEATMAGVMVAEAVRRAGGREDRTDSMGSGKCSAQAIGPLTARLSDGAPSGYRYRTRHHQFSIHCTPFGKNA
ncbi:hypothetical protein AB870_26425 [Pandoraea faecigallinarum]|nr:hypothetical protein AB870_26425 [Pandoraea faecigallinarum]